MARRFLARLGLSARVCGNCKSFDLEAGQKFMHVQKPVFGAVTAHVTPAMMARAKQIELAAKAAEDAKAALPPTARKIAEAVDAELPPPKPEVPELSQNVLDAKWEEFGKCNTHQRIDHRGNTCDRWS